MTSTRIIILVFLLFFTVSANCQSISRKDTTRSELERLFQNPPLSARPKALWPWVNGNFSFSAITYEMEEAKEKGMGGFDIWDVGTMINPGNIVPDGPPFLGDESLDGIAHAIREGNRLGLEIGLITSSSWNAGGSWVKPEHGAMGLFHSDTILYGPMEFRGTLRFPIIPDNYQGRKTLALRDKDGLPVSYKEVAILVHPLPSDSILQPKEILLVDTNWKSANEIQVSIPKGKHRLVRYVCAPTGQPLMIPSGKSNGRMLDHFSAEAQQANMDYIIGRLKTKFKSLNDQSLKYLYEDSYEVNTAVWTPRLPEIFMAKNGYTLFAYLPITDGFTINDKDFTNRFHFDFNKTLSDLIIENHYAKGREISEKEGLGFYAEAGGPGQPIHNVPFEDLKALGALTVPRGEFWNRHPQQELLQVVKGIASAAHIYNQKAVEAESFTSVWLWQEGPDELKPLADRAMCEGLNRFVYHTFSHTTPDAGDPGWIYNFGTLINTTNGWWPKSNGFHEYLARCSYLLQQGNFVGDVAFYYGDEAPNFVKPKHLPPSLGKGYDYDVVNSDVILNRMFVKDGKIILPHGQEYAVLVLPDDDRINPEVLMKIEKLIREGATVIGKKPIRSYSLVEAEKHDKAVRDAAERIWGKMSGKDKRYGKGKIVWKKTIREVLIEKNIRPDVIFTSATSHDSCDYIHRVTKDAEIYFIRNKSRRIFSGQATFRVNQKSPEWWNPVSGTMQDIKSFTLADNTTSIPLKLEGEESAFIVFRADQSTGDALAKNDLINSSNGVLPLSAKGTNIEIRSPWKVRLQHNGNVPSEIDMPELQSLHIAAQDPVKYFAGVATYSNHFIISKDQTRSELITLLSLNTVEEIADVYLNGEKLGTHWHHTQQFDISKKIKEGENILTIEVVNSINNALVGDARKPEKFRVYKSNISKLPNAWMKPFGEAPLLPAGLIGPVLITSYMKSN
jgi:hypothetical protein